MALGRERLTSGRGTMDARRRQSLDTEHGDRAAPCFTGSTRRDAPGARGAGARPMPVVGRIRRQARLR